MQFASGDLWAGAEVQLFHLARALKLEKDISLLVVLLNPGQLESVLKKEGVNVIVIDETTHDTYQITKKIYSIAKQFLPDVIHTHRIKENTIGGFITKCIGCKTVKTLHGSEEHNKQAFNLRKIMLPTLDRLFALFIQDKIICVSDELKQKVSRIYPQSKLEVIYNSVDINFIEEKAGQDITTGINPEQFNIGFVGRFVPVKNVGLFYQIAKNVIRKNHRDDIHFYMIGDGPEFDTIKNLIEQDKLSSRIHLVGFVENSAPYIAKLDCLLFTSKHEGLPMTLLEAMALNTVIFSTDLPTIKQVLQNDRGGYFPVSSEPEKFSQELLKQIENTSLLEQKAHAAKSILMDRYSLESNIQKYRELYQTVIK